MFSKKFVISTLKSISVLTLVIALSQSAAAQAQQPYFILDNDDAGYSSVGAWRNWYTGFQGDLDFKATGNGSAVATWEIEVPAGTYRVLTTWLPWSGRATNAPYTIYDGNTELTTVDVDQISTMKDYSAHGAVWDELSVVTITSGTLRVELSDDANGYVIADAILIERVEEEVVEEEEGTPAPPVPFEDTILDDDDPGYTSVGAWNNWGSAGFGGDVDYKAAGNGSAVATWELHDVPEGTYRVLATWLPYSGRATNAPYTIYDGNSALTTVEVNQVATMKDYPAHGTTWDELSIVNITSGTLRVELSDNANGYVIADGILVERVSP